MSADEGHTFRIAVTIRSSSRVVGEDQYTDAAEFSGPELVREVRAWNLKTALMKALAGGLDEWSGFDDPQEEVVVGDRVRLVQSGRIGIVVHVNEDTYFVEREITRGSHSGRKVRYVCTREEIEKVGG